MTDKIPTYEVNKELVLSTGHVSELTGQRLEKDDIGSLIVINSEYNWRIWIDPEFEPMYTKWDDIPQELKTLMITAKDLGCKWLLLDQDGPIMDNLVSFDW